MPHFTLLGRQIRGWRVTTILPLPSLTPCNSRVQLIEPHMDNLFKHFLERLEMQPQSHRDLEPRTPLETLSSWPLLYGRGSKGPGDDGNHLKSRAMQANTDSDAPTTPTPAFPEPKLPRRVLFLIQRAFQVLSKLTKRPIWGHLFVIKKSQSKI